MQLPQQLLAVLAEPTCDMGTEKLSVVSYHNSVGMTPCSSVRQLNLASTSTSWYTTRGQACHTRSICSRMEQESTPTLVLHVSTAASQHPPAECQVCCHAATGRHGPLKGEQRHSSTPAQGVGAQQEASSAAAGHSSGSSRGWWGPWWWQHAAGYAGDDPAVWTIYPCSSSGLSTGDDTHTPRHDHVLVMSSARSLCTSPSIVLSCACPLLAYLPHAIVKVMGEHTVCGLIVSTTSNALSTIWHAEVCTMVPGCVSSALC